MKQLDRFSHLISGSHKRDFIEMHWGLLALLGSLSFLVAGYLGLAISTVIPGIIVATNKFRLRGKRLGSGLAS